jgi:hypothetical protein
LKQWLAVTLVIAFFLCYGMSWLNSLIGLGGATLQSHSSGCPLALSNHRLSLSPFPRAFRDLSDNPIGGKDTAGEA